MRILLIRHGDPDYEHDTLTEKGRREAELLAKRHHRLRWEVVISLPLAGRWIRHSLSESDGKRCGSTGVAAGISGTAGSE